MGDLVKEIQNLVKSKEDRCANTLIHLVRRFDWIVRNHGIAYASKIKANERLNCYDIHNLEFYNIYFKDDALLVDVVREARVVGIQLGLDIY